MKWVNKLVIFLIIICTISYILALIGKPSSTMSFMALFLDRLFMVNLVIFVISGFVFIDNFGTFNVFKYSVRHFRATVSKKYKNQLLQENDTLETDRDIKTFLQKKFLFAQTKHNAANVYFAFSGSIFLLYIVITFVLV
ncbi:DUF3899 domain-containing protein [Vallitalea pronyensis]|uniref:DUF3899 domain-containing protein n=1 Tax=Vallitalea pronyensis TaxID=1348613 RepID=A0A8J8MHV6_9FIRM|nr:DUF3899 domain-containing protein [Vallitalea pronyensis]QUI21736.1 DUF3899 domain-containing protein [Vallitalea pronyensis]